MNALPIMREQGVQSLPIASRAGTLDLSPAPVPEPELREDLSLGAEGGGTGEGGGAGGADRAADAFFRADFNRIRREREASGLTYSLDDYKRDFGILLSENGKWRGTRGDPFGREVRDSSGAQVPRVVYLEDAGLVE